jgi:hypothetical protein
LTTRLEVDITFARSTATGLVAWAVKLSGPDPVAATDLNPVVVPQLASTAEIVGLELEYRGMLDSNLRWAAIISDTAPRPTAAIMAKMCSVGALASHDCKTNLFAAVVPGPPIVAEGSKARYLYILMEHAPSGPAAFKILVDVAGALAEASDHVTL